MAPCDAKSAAAASASTFAESRSFSDVSWDFSCVATSPQKKGSASASPPASPPLSPRSLAAFHSGFNSILRLFKKKKKKEEEKGARGRLEPAAAKPLGAMEGDGRSLHLSSKDSDESASESGDDQLGWLNAYADSTYSESNWIKRDRSGSRRSLRSGSAAPAGEGPAVDPPSPPRQSVEELFDTAMRGSAKRGGDGTSRNAFLSRKSPFLHYQKSQGSASGCSFEEAVDAMKRRHKVRSINKWLDSSHHFLDVQ